ncbi:SMP-30/gluconolactonase/LRE family protein [Consotaella salsifontis]|uniref:Sugar lactone lactonase YvrE n=1 Tax=Consotaella salsifontis TaxID=1365950 RepID=A0A1T4PWH6_9HYPH|nr:SMP-30/gluconolactonase/LRE family protein [Consotaella salsifontis]SJZ95883.1 Sugar lactone lactonase YvrE [Consotaella salsifontis]
MSEPESVGARVLSPHASELGEGPVYDPIDDTLWWFDILGKTLIEHRFATSETKVHELPFMASAMGLVDADHHLIAAEDGLYLRRIGDGNLALVAPVEADNPATRSNDGRAHASGAFWTSTMGREFETGAGSIYWFCRGEVRRLFSGLTVPNSICFSPDGTTAYFTDSRAHVLHRVAIDPATGLPTGEPEMFNDHRGKKGAQDGTVCDVDGLLWNACNGMGRLDVYAPDGRRVRSIALPVSRVTCPAFLGEKADRIAMTTAKEGLSPEEREREADAGRTFLLDIGVRGRLEPRVALG